MLNQVSSILILTSLMVLLNRISSENVKIATPVDTGRIIITEPTKVTPTNSFNEIEGHREPINYIRHRGEELGQSNSDIMKMIRIARCESKFKADAKNPNSTAKGIYQFLNGTWKANCPNSDVLNFIDNIDCAWKVYQKQGDTPWHSSQACWNK